MRYKPSQFSTACNTGDLHAHTGSGRDTTFSASVEQWWENHCTRFEDCSHYSLEDMRDLKRKFGLRTKLPLFSDPTTYGSVWAIPTYRVYRLYDKNVCCTLARFFCFIYRILISVSLLMKILLMNHLLSNLQMILFTSLHHPLSLDIIVPFKLLV